MDSCLCTNFHHEHDVRLLFENFKESGDAPGMQAFDQRIADINAELQDRQQELEEQLQQEAIQKKWDGGGPEMKYRFCERILTVLERRLSADMYPPGSRIAFNAPKTPSIPHQFPAF